MLPPWRKERSHFHTVDWTRSETWLAQWPTLRAHFSSTWLTYPAVHLKEWRRVTPMFHVVVVPTAEWGYWWLYNVSERTLIATKLEIRTCESNIWFIFIALLVSSSRLDAWINSCSVQIARWKSSSPSRREYQICVTEPATCSPPMKCKINSLIRSELHIYIPHISLGLSYWKDNHLTYCCVNRF